MRFGQNTTPDGLIRRGERLTKCENLWDTKNRKINHMIDKHFSKSLMSEVDDSFESEAPRLQEESDFLKSELEKLQKQYRELVCRKLSTGRRYFG